MEKEKKRGGCLKNVLIGFIILIVLGSCAALFGDNDEENDAETTDHSAEDQTEIDRQQKEHDEKEAAKEEKEAPKEESTEENDDVDVVEEENEEELTPVEEIKNVIADVVGEDSISEISVEEGGDGYNVELTYAASENFTANMTANGIKRNMVDIALRLQGIEPNISNLLMTATLPLTDSSGNESDGEVMTTSFYGETIDELNADNEVFLYDNLEDAADGFSAHPEFR